MILSLKLKYYYLTIQKIQKRINNIENNFNDLNITKSIQ